MIFKCKMCGGTIEFNTGDTVGTCDSCGTRQTLPRLDNEKKAQATAINDIQKRILDISGREEPYDIFICYKEPLIRRQY